MIHRYIKYAGMELLPADSEGERWHVPGCRIFTIDELVVLATSKNLPMKLYETSSEGSTVIHLN